MPKITSNIDKILSQIPDDEVKDFNKLVDSKSSLADLQKVLRELCEAYTVDIPLPSSISIHRWREKRFKLAREVENFNLLNSEYNGVRVEDIVEKLVFRVSQICFASLDLVEAKSEEISAIQQYKQLPSLIREVRQLCQLIADFRVKQIEQDLILSGASELFLMLKAGIADTPFEAGFIEMGMAAMEEMKKRYR